MNGQKNTLLEELKGMLPSFLHLATDEVTHKFDFIKAVKETYDTSNEKIAYFLSIAERYQWYSITKFKGNYSIHF